MRIQVVQVIAFALVLSANATAQTNPPRYWEGNLSLSGQATENARFSVRGNTLNFNSGTSHPVSSQIHSRIWTDQNGVVQWQADSCTYPLTPSSSGASLDSGGQFHVGDGVGSDCVGQNGEVMQREDVSIARQNDSLQLSYRQIWTFQQPYAGRADVSGQAYLSPVYPSVQTALAAPVQRQAAAPLSGLAADIDAIVSEDSQRWWVNRYDPGSVTDAQIERHRDGSADIRANYTFNRGLDGWVHVHMVGGRANCVEYWDFQGICRPIGSASSSYAALAGLTAGGASGSSQQTPGDALSDWDAARRAEEIQNNAQDARQIEHPNE